MGEYGDCCACGNKIVSNDMGDGKIAGQGAVHYMCYAEAKRRDRELLCKICGKTKVRMASTSCSECEKLPDDYMLKDFYNSLPK